MTREKAHEQIECLHINDIQTRGLHLVIDKIYDDFENKSCDGCKSIEDSKTLMKGIIPLECMFCIRKNTDNFKKAESIDEQTKNIVS